MKTAQFPQLARIHSVFCHINLIENTKVYLSFVCLNAVLWLPGFLKTGMNCFNFEITVLSTNFFFKSKCSWYAKAQFWHEISSNNDSNSVIWLSKVNWRHCNYDVLVRQIVIIDHHLSLKTNTSIFVFQIVFLHSFLLYWKKEKKNQYWIVF